VIVAALIRKEVLLLSRDPHALGALLLMPTLFIVLMAFALSAVNQEKLPPIDVSFTSAATNTDTAFFEQALAKQLGEGHLRDATPDKTQIHLAADVSESLLDTDARTVQVTYPPAVDTVTRQRLRAIIQTGLAQSRLHAFLLETGDLSAEQPLAERLNDVVQRTQTLLDEREVSDSGKPTEPANASQHSVPAWLIFGMFFVMLPMAHSFQHERQSGALMRLRCLDLDTFTMAFSKLVPYLGLNMLQFVGFLALGTWGLPLLGLPGLSMAGAPLAYAALAISLALAACTLGLAIATLARNAEQALLLSAGINIILAAIGGIMVPKSVMPDAMRHVAELSPMSWALDAFRALLVGHGDLTSVAPFCGRLLLFACIVGTFAIVLFRRRLRDMQWVAQI
jgi:ABC-2 type transport system permease protein